MIGALWFTTLVWLAPAASAWQPGGAARPGQTRACHPHLWAKKYLAERDSDARWRLLQNHLQNCAAEAAAGRPQAEDAETVMEKLEWSASLSETIAFTGREGQKLSGRLFLQTDTGPLPLVIAACDFDCEPESDPWLKALVMQIYEEGRSHLLIVHSPEWLADTRGHWLAGGLEYGQDLLEAGFWAQVRSGWRSRISSVHLIGKGWAAMGALDALLYNDRNPIADDRKVFHSVIALCPAVKLDSVLMGLSAPANPRAGALALRVAEKLANLELAPRESWIDASLAWTRQNFIWLNPFRLRPPATRGEWLEANDFTYQGLGLKTPAWVLGATGDPLFPADGHWRPLARQHRDPKKSRVHVTGLEDATACAWQASHGWSFSGNLLRTLIAQQAFEIWPRSQIERNPWRAGSPPLADSEFHLDQEWLAGNGDGIRLRFHIGRRMGGKLVAKHAVDVPVPISALPPGLRAMELGNASRATRQLNAWLRIYGATGPLVDSIENAAYLEFSK
jgi:hypothetical protein